MSPSKAAPSTTEAPAAPSSSPWAKVVSISVLATIIVTVFVLAFTWPTKTAETRDLPVSIAGPSETVDQFKDMINENSPGTFDFVEADDRGQAEDQIKHRETYGAIIFNEQPNPPEVLTAPAANATATQILTGIAEQLQERLQGQIQGQVQQMQQQAQASGTQPSVEQMQQMQTMQQQAANLKVSVTPVVSFSDDDPNGAGFTAASFPLVLGGMIGGVLMNMLIQGVWRRLIAAAAYSLIGGLVLTLIMNTWFGYIQGEFVLDWMAFALSLLGTASLILGCTALLGNAGIGIGALITMLLGNPLSGAQVPWQFYPKPWGALGQDLVPGASSTLLRTLSFFPDASTARQWWILGMWALIGVALTIIGYFVHHHHKDEKAQGQESRGLDYAAQDSARGEESSVDTQARAGAETGTDAAKHPAPRHRAG